MVNTFITSSSFRNCAKNLDYKRLGKQRVEALQIIDILMFYDRNNKLPKKGFSNHPVVKMWLGYTNALKYYCNCMIEEWIFRGYKNTMAIYDLPKSFERPWWITFRPLHYSHRAALWRKDQNYYSFLREDTEVDKYIQHGYLWVTSNNVIENFNFSMLDKIGTGAPANYQLTLQEVEQWLTNKTINPKTNREIKIDGPTYKLFEKAQKLYNL